MGLLRQDLDLSWGRSLNTEALPSDTEVRSLSGYNGYSLAISPDSQTLISAGQDQTITIWNLQTFTPVR